MYSRNRPRCEARRAWRKVGWIALSLAFASACASTPELPHIPPVTRVPSGEHLPGKFVWYDLVSQDVAASKAFYGALFGWTFEGDGRYQTILRDGIAIGGVLPARDPERGSEWVSNLSVPDVDAALKAVKRHGGVVERPAVDAPDRGRLAVVSSENAIVLLVRATGGDPPDQDPALNGWLWNELWTHQPEETLALYRELVGYQGEIVEFRGGDYQVLKSQGRARAGIVPAPPEVNPLWLPYLRVEDSEASAARAATLGARVVYTDDRTAILVDPTGAEIGIGEWQQRQAADAEASQ